MGRDGGREGATSIRGPGQAPGCPTPGAQTCGLCHQRKRGSFPSLQREGNMYHFLPCAAYKGAGSLKHGMEKKKHKHNHRHLPPSRVCFFPFSFLLSRLATPSPAARPRSPPQRGVRMCWEGRASSCPAHAHRVRGGPRGRAVTTSSSRPQEPLLSGGRGRQPKIRLVPCDAFSVSCLALAWLEDTQLRHRSFPPETGHLRPLKSKCLVEKRQVPLNDKHPE